MDRDKPVAPMNWMQRLKRIFAIDIETCPDCGGTLRVSACRRIHAEEPKERSEGTAEFKWVLSSKYANKLLPM